jgi:hypothetical protein
MGARNDNNRYVQRRFDGGWEVVKEDHERASAVERTKAEAIDRARNIVRNAGGGELVIKDRHGRIRDSDTVPPGHESSVHDKR